MEWELQPERSSRAGLGRGHAKAFGFTWKTPGWTDVANDPPPLPTPCRGLFWTKTVAPVEEAGWWVWPYFSLTP